MALPLDMPDNYPWLPGSGKSSVGDLGELAARLFSPDTYDRRGSVYWLWDGSTGLSPWYTGLYGTGASAQVLASNAPWSGYCVRLTAGSDGGRAAQIAHYMAPVELRRVGVECAVSVVSEWETFRLGMRSFDGTNLTSPFIRLNRLTNTLQVYKDDDSWGDVAALPNPIHAYGMYHNLKLVFDLGDDLYARLLYDDTEVDLSDYALRVTADANPDLTYVLLDHVGRAGNNDNCLIGRVILTIGEP